MARSTLADANNNRSSDIFRDVFYALFEKCRELAPKHKFKFKNPLYTFDSTLVNVCLSLFSWAKYRTKKGAFKLHTLLSPSENCSSIISILFKHLLLHSMSINVSNQTILNWLFGNKI